MDAAGNLYGTTGGGGAFGYGTMFELKRDPNGSWTESVLHSFNYTNGANPVAGLVFESIPHFQKALDLYPSSSWIRAQLAWSYAMKGMYPQALATIRKHRSHEKSI